VERERKRERGNGEERWASGVGERSREREAKRGQEREVKREREREMMEETKRRTDFEKTRSLTHRAEPRAHTNTL
jgi:hypothetical protein